MGAGNPHSPLLGQKTSQGSLKSLCRVLRKVNANLPLLNYSTSCHMPKGFNIILHRYLFIAALFAIARKWNQSKCPSSDK